MNLSQKKRWKKRIGYGTGDFGLNLFWQSTSFYLLFYYTDVLNIPSAVAGTIFAICGLWVALIGPVIGYFAERTKSRFGSYRSYLIYGCIPLAISFILLFMPIRFEGTAMAIYATAIFFLFNTCYMLVAIPYASLGARISIEGNERTRISATRMYFAFLGGTFVIGLSTLLQELFIDEIAFPLMALIGAVVSIGFLVYCFFNTTEERNFASHHKTASSIKILVQSIGANRALMLLWISLMFMIITNTVIGHTILYYFEYNLGDRLLGNTTIILMMMTPLLTIPIWSALGVKYGKRTSWKFGCMITILGIGVFSSELSDNAFGAMFSYFLITVGTSAFAVLQWSMIADAVDHGEYKTGIRNESIVFGVIASAKKIVASMTILGIGFGLEYIGYTAGQQQSVETLSALKQIIIWIPLFSIAVSLLGICYFPVSSQGLKAMRVAKERLLSTAN